MANQQMPAIRVDDGTLDWTAAPAPECGPDGVVLDVAATAVNRADLLQRRGLYPSPEGVTSILGLEVAGVVRRVGDRVDEWQVGDRAAALLPGGGYADRAAIPADMLLPVPDDLALARAAALPEVFYTAYLNLRLEAGLASDDSVLIHAGASGVGTAAVQLAKLFEARCFATASAAKLPFLRRLGVDVAIDRREGDFTERLERATAAGVDIVLDPVGGDYLPRNVDALAPEGRLVVIGLLGGSEGRLPLGDLLRKQLEIIGSVLRTRPRSEKVAITEAFRDEVWPAFGRGELEAVIFDALPIDEADRAHSMLETNRTVGKVVLIVDADRAGDPGPLLRESERVDV